MLSAVKLCFAAIAVLQIALSDARTFLGSLRPYQHQVRGDVYALDCKTLVVENFYYDGLGPAVSAWVGSSPANRPSSNGKAATVDYSGRTFTRFPLQRHSDTSFTVTLPDGYQLNQIKWFSIWCEAFRADFGSIIFSNPIVVQVCRPDCKYLGILRPFQHEVSGTVCALDCKTLIVDNFFYDGLGPSVAAWVGTNPPDRPSSDGVAATVEYDGTTFTQFPRQRHAATSFTVTLPDGYELNQIKWFSIWCRTARADFGSVIVSSAVAEESCRPKSKVYCQNFRDDYSACWRVDTANQSIEISLCSDGLDSSYFMGFGISGSDQFTSMFFADPTLCWRDGETVKIEDFHISAYAQCGTTGGDFTGVCQDTTYNVGVDNLSKKSADTTDGVFCCTYTRPLMSTDTTRDRPFRLSGPQAVVWAIGPVFRNVILKHPVGYRAVPNVFVDFSDGTNSGGFLCSKDSTTDCCKGIFLPDPTMPPMNSTASVTPTMTAIPNSTMTTTCPSCKSWRNRLQKATHFVFTLGPSGERCGYQWLTDSNGAWGIAWYVNGCLIPHLKLKRGTTYTFCVNGGDNSTIPSQFHPLYFTSSPFGGISQYAGTNETVYGGFDEDGKPMYTGPYQILDEGDINRCCLKRRMVPTCAEGSKIFTFTPDENTPDELYYQCATHALLGWKIRVRD